MAKAEVWVHGVPAHSWDQVISYLKGDTHAQSKVQVFVDGKFHDVVLKGN